MSKDQVSSRESSISGRLYGVGVGPGDPELLTLKALRVIQEVPVVCVPQSDTSQESYALGIVQEFLNPARQEVLRVTFPTDDAGGAAAAWRSCTTAIVERLLEGQDVAFLTEGDPMLYSTFCYVLENMREEQPSLSVEMVPGVSSVMAAAAAAGVPLAANGQRLAILPAVYGINDLSEAVANYDTIVLMKVSRTLLEAVANLESLGLAGRSVFIRRATTPREKVVRDLNKLSEEDLDYFSLLIISR